jgi:hypothetical protein
MSEPKEAKGTQVHYAGEESIIHEPTGVLLQPGVNLIADPDHARALVEDGYATEVAEEKAQTRPRAKKEPPSSKPAGGRKKGKQGGKPAPAQGAAPGEPQEAQEGTKASSEGAGSEGSGSNPESKEAGKQE